MSRPHVFFINFAWSDTKPGESPCKEFWQVLPSPYKDNYKSSHAVEKKNFQINKALTLQPRYYRCAATIIGSEQSANTLSHKSAGREFRTPNWSCLLQRQEKQKEHQKENERCRPPYWELLFFGPIDTNMALKRTRPEVQTWSPKNWRKRSEEYDPKSPTELCTDPPAVAVLNDGSLSWKWKRQSRDYGKYKEHYAYNVFFWEFIEVPQSSL